MTNSCQDVNSFFITVVTSARFAVGDNLGDLLAADFAFLD